MIKVRQGCLGVWSRSCRHCSGNATGDKVVCAICRNELAEKCTLEVWLVFRVMRERCVLELACGRDTCHFPTVCLADLVLGVCFEVLRCLHLFGAGIDCTLNEDTTLDSCIVVWGICSA